jgi:hypothetical protein
MNSSVNFPELTHNEIAARARSLWTARGCPTGCDDEIWLDAERQLTAERRGSSRGRNRSGSSVANLDIDEDALADRLDDFGDPGSRSATSLDPTK